MQNSELKIFNYENANVRTTVINGEIWFVLKDVCEVLGIHNSKMVATRLDDDEKAKVSQTDLIFEQNICKFLVWFIKKASNINVCSHNSNIYSKIQSLLIGLSNYYGELSC